MTLWLIEPRDPLIFRDGKPFTAIPGSRARSLPFPFPSTVVGAVRTHCGRDPATGRFDTSRIEELLAKSVRGPLLVETGSEYSSMDACVWLLPAPADALVLKLKNSPSDQALRRWLRPVHIPGNAATDLEGLSVVGLTRLDEQSKQKPHPKAPRYWKWETYKAWLQSPAEGIVTVTDLGHQGPKRESRVHVSIEKPTQTALEGALFQTSGLEFVRVPGSGDPPELSSTRELALAVDTDADLWEGLGFLGGERRVVRWRRSQCTLPDCPQPVRESIKAQRSCRVILLTPALFQAGHLPTRFLDQSSEVKATLQGAAVPRYLSVSGWDYRMGQAKPSRRLAPPGSVYFLSLDGDEPSIDAFIDAVWMQSISDDPEDCRDGFGLAVLGAWDDDLPQMEVEP